MSLPLQDHRVAFTGRLASMTQVEARLLVLEKGGTPVPKVTPETTLLVVGEEGWPFRGDGRPTRDLERARSTSAEVLEEGDFLERVGDGERLVRGRFTLPRLAHLLKVSTARLRAWRRRGLFAPVEVLDHVEYFDFRTVTRARSLVEMLESNVSTARLVESLEAMKRWLPAAADPLDCLRRGNPGRPVVRIGDRLAEPSGQFLIDFDEEPVATMPVPRSADDLFDEALAHEEFERFDEAVRVYGELLELEPDDAAVHFNLANVLAASDRCEEAIEAYRDALQLDHHYPEAWCNLGNALAECGDETGARDAYRSALLVAPAYADAHYNLADVLERLGRPDEAARHWREYLRHDDRSEWADHVRDRLRGV